MTQTAQKMQSPVSTHSGNAEQKRAVRRAINIWVICGASLTTWSFAVHGLPMNQFCKELGMTPFGFGLLGGLIMYGQLAQLLGSYLVERYGHRKLIVVVGGLIHRLIWLPIAFFPLLGGGEWRWQAVLVLGSLSFAIVYMTFPAGTSWIADLIPGKVQGRFMARRMQVGQFAGLIAMLGISYGLDKAKTAGDETWKIALVGMMVVVGTIGVIEYVLHIFILEPPKLTPKPNVKLWSIIWKPLSDREFLCFIGYHCTISCSTVFMGQFAIRYLYDVLLLTNFQIMALMTVIPSIITAASFPFWGRIADRAGYKPALAVGGLGYILVVFWLVFASPSQWYYLFGAFVLLNCLIPSLETGTAVMMYTKVSSEHNPELGSSYPALYGISMTLCTILTSVLAGFVAMLIGEEWRGTLMGHNLTYHWIIIIIGLGMRVCAMLWLAGIKNTKHISIAQTISVIWKQAGEDAVKITAKPKRWLNGK